MAKERHNTKEIEQHLADKKKRRKRLIAKEKRRK